MQLLRQFYSEHRRELPWRELEPDGSLSAYKVLVSELMLQQTQVIRVIPKYHQFLQAFPTINDLAAGNFSDVIKLWAGLGYNRRARYLWDSAREVSLKFDGAIPVTISDLSKLPGIGPNTAGAILAYAHNKPVTFIETNIRSVILHHFFTDQVAVSDAAVSEMLQRIVPWEKPQPDSSWQPRDFYWALMDYGSALKLQHSNPSRRSQGYKKQSGFEGSRRQLRGSIIRLLKDGPQHISAVKGQLNDERLDEVIGQLQTERLISLNGKTLMLYNGND